MNRLQFPFQSDYQPKPLPVIMQTPMHSAPLPSRSAWSKGPPPGVVAPLEGVKSVRTPVTTPTGHGSVKVSMPSRSSVAVSGASSSTTSIYTTPTAGLVTAASSLSAPDPTSSKVRLDVKNHFQNPLGTTSPSSSRPAPNSTHPWAQSGNSCSPTAGLPSVIPSPQRHPTVSAPYHVSPFLSSRSHYVSSVLGRYIF